MGGGNPTLTDLRALAQSFGIGDVFQMDATQLRAAIEAKQVALTPKPRVPLPAMPVDGRLLTKPVARKADKAMVEEALSEYVARGVRLEWLNDETWRISWDKREDTGTVRQSLRAIVMAARRLISA